MPSVMANGLLSVPSACIEDRAVGQHAVDVEQQQLDRRRSALRASESVDRSQTISVRHRSCRCTTPATRAGVAVDDDDRRDLALLHDVQRFGGERGRRQSSPGRASSRRRRSARGCRPPRSMCRRRSPSVMMPSSAVVVVDDAGHAEALARHLVDHVAHPRVGATRSGTACRRASAPRRASAACRACRRDAGSRSPPARKPFSTSSVIASASPIASAAVVLAVGTRFSGQASSVTLQSSATSAACASVEPARR